MEKSPPPFCLTRKAKDCARKRVYKKMSGDIEY